MHTVSVNPEILAWARKTAGLTLEEAAAKLPVKKAYGVSGVDRLRELETGKREPTVPMLERMAKVYYRPAITFYLDAPPAPSDAGIDYRSNAALGSPREEARLKALVRNILGRQRMVRNAMESEEEAEPVWFIGELPKKAGVGTTRNHVVDALMRGGSDVERIFQVARSLLDEILGPNLDVEDYYRQNSPDGAFGLLRKQVENSGVFVLLKGDLGSYHSVIDVRQFRGLAIADKVAPFIVINDRDSITARSFTLLHELTHLCVDSTGVSGPNSLSETNRCTGVPDDDRHTRVLERFCNRVASDWLLSDGCVDSLDITGKEDNGTLEDKIHSLARKKNLSHTMVAYRLLLAEKINQRTYAQLRESYYSYWQRIKTVRKQNRKQSSGGPSYYVVHRHRVGGKLLDFSFRMLYLRVLSTTKVATVLGASPTSVGKLLRPDLAI